MHKPLLSLLLTCLAGIQTIMSQPPSRQPDGGGNYADLIKIKDEISPEQRAGIINMLKQNETVLRGQGRLQPQLDVTGIAFSWPLKQALGNNDNGFYGISNYVDENMAYPNAVLDYNCGNRSYDQISGYNHMGTDIFTWPFYWQKMERNAVEIIAASPGTIIGKSDGNYDQNCAFCVTACDWNAVYIMHADGSVAWYGHMKSGSLTKKAIGENVELGEYLGVVGSSGNSTGPHLHFEVYTNSSYTQLVDPWAGSCNNLNGFNSWWASQQSYYVSTLNKIMTHGAPPNMTSCPVGDAPNEKINFADGQTVYLGSYYRDQQAGQQAFHTIYRPDNTVYANWTQTFDVYYSASWWWYSIVLPGPAATGSWRYEVVYNSKRLTSWFSVNSTLATICPGSYTPLFSNLSGATFQWQVNTGNGFANITDNSVYAGTNTVQLLLKTVPSSFYGYQYRCLVNNTSFSQVISLKMTSFWVGANSSAWDDPFNWSCGVLPDGNTDVIVYNDAKNFPEINSNVSCASLYVSPELRWS
ncbi:MAG: peptidoglycan DD-metalloendopeptidase family protein [Bacteroidota bacterium]